MTTDLMMLTASAVLCALLFIPYGIAQTFVWGIPVSVGNRDAPPPLPAWAERGIRAQRNMLENFPHFAALVIVGYLVGASNDATALALIRQNLPAPKQPMLQYTDEHGFHQPLQTRVSITPQM